MSFEKFKKEWKSAMVFKIGLLDDEFFNSVYSEYKETLREQVSKMSVLEFCEFWYEDITLDTHDFMLKSKAIKTKHANGLIDLANKFRKNARLPRIKRKEK